MLNPLKIESVRVHSKDEFLEHQLIRKNWSCFLFCHAGNGNLRIDKKSIDISENSVVNILANSHLDNCSFDHLTKLTVVNYSEEVKNILSSHSLTLFCPVTGLLQVTLDPNSFSDLAFYIRKIETSLSNPSTFHFEVALLNLILIAKELSSFVNFENSVRRINNKTVLDFIQLLDQTYQSEKTVEYYCDHLNISSKTLYRALKENIGVSPKEFILAKLNMEAKKLLSHSTLSIKQVSSQLGFQSQYYFTTFFKKFNQASPSSYREEMSDFSIILS